MTRGASIFTLGLVGAAVAYGAVYFASTSSARSLQRSERPELAWLQQEFQLNDAEFKRVSELHSAYLPQCGEMCRQVDAQNQKLQKLLANSTTVTPEIDAALAEAARLRTDCQRAMLQHFLEVSRTMPPEQGQRYFAWVQQRVFLPNHGMPAQ